MSRTGLTKRVQPQVQIPCGLTYEVSTAGRTPPYRRKPWSHAPLSAVQCAHACENFFRVAKGRCARDCRSRGRADDVSVRAAWRSNSKELLPYFTHMMAPRLNHFFHIWRRWHI